MTKQGILLINLGSPDSPGIGDVRRYLREFLMDERVIDVNYAARLAIVYGLVLPFRPARSAHAYRQIWTDKGSPLILHTASLRDKLRARTGKPVEMAMRYQNPTVASAIGALQRSGVDEILAVPLFPHYAMSSYESAVEHVKRVARDVAPHLVLSILKPYFERPEYVDALVASARQYLSRPYDHLLFSFHGVPERHIRKSDDTGRCLSNSCGCAAPHPKCYKNHCVRTVRAFASAAGLKPGTYSYSFQSRLGRDAWLQPYTHEEIRRLAGSGIKRLVVICPAFTADCLETLEEIGIQGRISFLEAGGEEFQLVPCLNDHPAWVEAIASLTVSLKWDVQPEALYA